MAAAAGSTFVSHPLPTVDLMDFVAAIIIVVAVIGVGLAVIVAVRHRDDAVQEAVGVAIASAVGEARDAFDTRLATGKTELEQRHRAIDEEVRGFKADVEKMRDALMSVQTAAARQHGAIAQQLSEAARGTSELTKAAGQLKDVLSNPAARGKWGERMAEDILRVAGMKENVNYLKQTKLPTGRIPDYTFLLPKGERLHMDVKFPWAAHSEYPEAASESERHAAAKKLRLAVRDHVNCLVGRDGYLDSQEAVGCVLMFIPNDGLYASIHEGCRDETDHALEKGVLICSPSTLLAVLFIVRKAMDTFALERSAQEILGVLGEFETQWDKFTAAITTVSNRADLLRKGVDELMPGGTRRRVMDRQLGKIEHLRESSALNSDRCEEPEAGRVRLVS